MPETDDPDTEHCRACGWTVHKSDPAPTKADCTCLAQWQGALEGLVSGLLILLTGTSLIVDVSMIAPAIEQLSRHMRSKPKVTVYDDNADLYEPMD
jgi:hypothetical protein